MSELQPIENEDNQPAANFPQRQLPPGRKDEGNALVTPTGTRETDAVTETGAVAGRGPGSTMEFQPRRIALTRGLVALQHRDFRLFWLSQVISLIGTWMQILAQSWLVLEIGGSAIDLGTIGALQFLPTLGFSLFGGILADHFPKRTLVLGTQSAAMILAFVLAALSWLGIVTIPVVMVMAFLLGLVNAVDMPTRQAYVVELVGRRDLPNAVALNSAAFNAARLVGPAIGGLFIGWFGTTTVFFLNGVSFIPVLIALLAMRAGSRAVATGIRPGSVFVHIQEGLSYVRRTPLVFAAVILIAVVGTFGMNFNVIAPLFAKDVLNVGADGFGVLMSAMGVGSLFASLMLAFLDWVPHPRLLVVSALAFGVLEVVTAGTAQFIPAAILLGATGFAMIVFTTVANTTLQTSTPDHLRGRVMSVYTTVFVGTTPIGSLFSGALAEIYSVPFSLFAGGAISVIAALISWLPLAGLRHEPLS